MKNMMVGIRRFLTAEEVPRWFGLAIVLIFVVGLTTVSELGNDRLRSLAFVLVVLCTLLLVYRCLREQLRSMSRIASRLETHHDRLQEDIDSLRLVDTADAVGASWNKLIDLTKTLSESVQRSDANEELSRALDKASGGALAEALCAIPDGLLYITDEIRFEYMNTTMRRLLGWKEDQDAQRTLQEASSDGFGSKIVASICDALQPSGSYESRSEVLDTDETGDDQSVYHLRIIPLQRSHTSGECIVVVRDISQQVRADRAREEFITQVTHELRTPLTNIQAYTETLSSGMFDDPSIITECYNVITKETRRLSRLIEDMLSVSQLEVGSIELQLNQVDLKELLSDATRDVRSLADEKNIDLQLVLPSKLEPIQGDRDKLAVVINNLLGNALKYTPENGNVVVGCQAGGSHALITVKDNGIGIDAVDQARVFDKFHRSKDEAVQSQPGTGIGLYTAREIVRRHRGDIELMSEKGQGSTFVVRLPRQETRGGSLTTQETNDHRVAPGNAGITLLKGEG